MDEVHVSSQESQHQQDLSPDSDSNLRRKMRKIDAAQYSKSLDESKSNLENAKKAEAEAYSKLQECWQRVKEADQKRSEALQSMLSTKEENPMLKYIKDAYELAKQQHSYELQLQGILTTKFEMKSKVVQDLEVALAQEKVETCNDEWIYALRNTKLDMLPVFGKLVSFIQNDPPKRIPLNHDFWVALNTADHSGINSDLINHTFMLYSYEYPPSTVNTTCTIWQAVSFTHRGFSEDSYHTIWDDVFSKPLALLCDGISVDRNTSFQTSTSMQRPDLCTYINNICVFRGEEKKQGVASSTPCQEISKKIVWTYGNVGYLLGYAASGLEVRLVAIIQGDNNTAVTKDIAYFNLNNFGDRLRLFRAVLNISVILPMIASRCEPQRMREFQSITRVTGVKIRLYSDHVIKSYPDPKNVIHLVEIYKAMNSAVPNVDKLISYDVMKCHVLLQPVGYHAPVLTLKALLSVLRDVLESLKVLHKLVLVHRDIRWDNVMKSKQEDKWFIIDFDEAMKYPCENKTAMHLNKATHAPEMFIDGKTHDCSVDIWGVGYLIYSANLTCTAEVKSLMHSLMNDNPNDRPTAVDAFNGVVRLIGLIAN